MNTLDAVCSRYSCRAYTDTPVSEEVLKDIVAAGSLAAIGKGQTGNLFITVIRDKTLLKLLDEAGQKMAGNPGYHAFYNAPVLVSVAMKGDDSLGKENCAAVVENMMLAAADMGVDSVYLHSPCRFLDDDAELFSKLGAPEGFVPGAFVALGYAAKERPAVRELKSRVETLWL